MISPVCTPGDTMLRLNGGAFLYVQENRFRSMYYFVSQTTGTDKQYYETHCARDYNHAIELCKVITRYSPSTCEIIVLNNGHLMTLPFTHLGDAQVDNTNDDFTTQSLQASTC